MLSNYNVSAKTVLNGFDTVEYDNQFKTGSIYSWFSLILVKTLHTSLNF